MKQKGIEIVGGGIAGLSLAVGLRMREVPVVVREAGSYPRHRLCGEFINGVSEETLGQLGLEGFFSNSQLHREMTWWLRGEKIAAAELENPVRALSRWEMDQRLSERVQELGGEIQCRQRVSPEPAEGRVWSAGRKRGKESDWLGLKVHYLGLDTCSGLEMHLGDDGYLGLTPVENGRVNVCGLFRQREGMSGKGSARLRAYLEACGLGELSERLQGAEADEKSLTGISGIQFGLQEQESELLALGDAERMIPPFTGNGMSMAFEAAECALGPLQSFSRGHAGWAAVRSEIRRKLQRRFRRRVALARGMHGALLNSPQQDWLAHLARPGFLPISLLNRLLT